VVLAEVVAVDIGGTSIKASLVGPRGLPSAPVRLPTPVGGGPAAIVDAVARVVGGLRTPGTGAVGCAVPGVVEPGTGVVRRAANLGIVDDLPLGPVLAARLGLPVTVEHDVRAACRAEAELGAARSVGDAVVVVAGTGLAAGLLVGGRVVTGTRGAAGEFGHIPVVPDGEPCACGQRGCAEAYASAGGLRRRYRDRSGPARPGPARSGPAQPGPARSEQGPTAAELVSRLDEDPLARALWAEACVALGRALVATTALLDPAAIVLAGGLSLAGPLLADPVRAALADGLAWRDPPPVVLSGFGDRAGVVGAGLVARASLRTAERRVVSRCG
jgi:glucokinase